MEGGPGLLHSHVVSPYCKTMMISCVETTVTLTDAQQATATVTNYRQTQQLPALDMPLIIFINQSNANDGFI